MTHPGGNVAPRSFSYNAGGMLLSETNPEAGTTSYEYDGLGRIISRKDAANRVLAYVYDSWDRITQLTGADVSRSYTYDGGPFGKGRLTSVTDEAGVTTITNRDALGRPLELQRTTDGRTYLTRYSFDAHGNLSSLEYPHATNEAVRLALSYTYNSAGLPTSIIANGSQSIAGQITYNAALGPRSMQLGNGVTYSMAADPASRNRPTTISTAGVKKNNQPFDLSMAYRYDSRGLIDQITNNGRVDSYTYDPRQMLTGVTYTGEGAVSYAYDANGNMTSRSSTNPTWAANLNFTRSYTNNKITDPGFAYSPTGALVTMPGNQYEYDGLDQLRRADQRFRFLYDGNGLQAIKLDEQTGTKQYQFYGAGDQLLTRYAAASGAVPTATEDLIYFGNHILATSDSSFHWVVSDHRGTARLLVDAQGTVEGEFEDFPFGEAKTRTTFGLPSIYQFKQRDDDLGLYDFGARWYSEKLGRFLTVDPFAGNIFPRFPDTWNRFSYVSNSPNSWIDPLGLTGISADFDTGLEGTEHELDAANAVLDYLDPLKMRCATLEAWHSGERGWQLGKAILNDTIRGVQFSLIIRSVFRWGTQRAVVATAEDSMLTSRFLAEAGPASKGVPESAKFAQDTFSAVFQRGGLFEGKTVAEVGSALRSGKMNPEELPINFIFRNGEPIILNTRSAQALESAGIPRVQWNGIDRTGNPVFEKMLDNQLTRNPGGPFVSVRPR